MQITFTPMRRDDRLTLHRAGDVLTLNGESYDFSRLPEGAVLPRDAVECGWLASDVTRTDGQLSLTLVLPHGADAPHQTLFPQPMNLTADGPVTLPPHGADMPLPVDTPSALPESDHEQD
ncbi:hypothetical protein [Pseudotabrizicola algicola]|uniref:Uncharacterized protein n=1 Tax=Pseudotabrizicola algicola TaxID=2709381 RepID=A0A6B3RNS1_9RHOB|nr:hypothetical protein [Pseudotabrizicola algicola]NEX47747.1 hypothetical protein [Pseudotabrizicola algicola]